MRLFINIDNRNFVESPTFPRAISTLDFKRRDTDLIELQFLRDNTVQELPTGTTVRLGLKSSGDYSASFLATASTFTKSGTGTSTKYLADLNLNTTDLNTAFSTATPAEPDSIPAMLEIEWTSGANISSSKTLPVTIANDVIRGNEGTPATLPLFYTSSTSNFLATQAEAEAGTDNTKWLSPLRTFQAIAAWLAANPIGSTWATLTGKPATFPPEAHNHNASDITTGTLALARIPTGTTASTVALGNHTHSNLDSPLEILQGGDTLTINPWGIESNYGPTYLSFEAALLNHGNSEVLNWGNTGELSVASRRLTNLGAPVNANDAVRKVDLDNLSVPSNLSQQVTSITGTSNHNLTSNRWHIFTGSPSTGNHTFTLPQDATTGALVYISFLTTATTGFQVMRFGYEGGSPQAVHSSFETGKTYLFHYNDFDTARWRKVTFA